MSSSGTTVSSSEDSVAELELSSDSDIWKPATPPSEEKVSKIIWGVKGTSFRERRNSLEYPPNSKATKLLGFETDAKAKKLLGYEDQIIKVHKQRGRSGEYQVQRSPTTPRAKRHHDSLRDLKRIASG
jgi:hypothetical protein